MQYFLFLPLFFTIVTIIFKLLKNKNVARFLMPITITLWLLVIIYVLLSHEILLVLVILYFVVIMTIGKFRYYKLKITNLKYHSNKLDNDYKIIYISDFQFEKNSTNINLKALDNVINKINTLQYDIILLGGDYVNYAHNIDIIIDRLNNINYPKYGMYAVCGNHDYVNYEAVRERLEKNNIKVLDNDNHLINHELMLSGVEDEWFGNPVLKKLDSNFYNLLLAHNPDYINKESKDNDIELMLSGHYHAGQFNFLIFKIPKLISKYVYGKYKYGNTDIYVSSGIGGTFMRGRISFYTRFLADPEIVFIDLRKE